MPDITPQQAMAELARRELVKRGASTGTSGSWTSYSQDIGNNFKSAIKDTGEAAGVAANTALLGIPGMISKKVSGKDVFAGDDLSTTQKLESMGIGMATDVGGVIKGISEIPIVKNIIKFSNPKNVGLLAKDVDNSLLGAHSKVVDNYGPEYDRIIGKSDKSVNLSDTVKKLSEEEGNPLQNPKFSNTPVAKLLENMSNKVDKGQPLDDISVKNADYIQKAIKNIPSIKTKLEKGYKTGFHNVDWTNEERIALKFANDVKSKVIDSEPELAVLNKDYGSFMNNYKAIRGSFGTKANGGTASLMSKYSDLEKMNPNFTDAIKSVIPNAAKKMKEYSDTLKQYNILKKLGLWGAATAGGGAIAKEAWNLTGH